MINLYKGNRPLFIKPTAIIGIVIAAAIGVFDDNQPPQKVFSGHVSITTLRIKIPFDQGVSGFDSKEGNKIDQSRNVKTLFRGTNINAQSNVVVIHRSNPGAIQKLLSETKEMLESTVIIMIITQTNDWSFE